NRGDTVLPLARELTTGVVVCTDATDLSIDDVVVYADVGHSDRARVGVRFDLRAGKHSGHRRRDAKVSCERHLVIGEAVLLDWSYHRHLLSDLLCRDQTIWLIDHYSA